MQLQFRFFRIILIMQLQFFFPELILHKYSVEGCYSETSDQVCDQKGCMAYCRHAGVYSQELQTRLQDIVDTEVVQTGRTSSIVSQGQTSLSLSSGTAQSSSSGTALAAGRPAPEDSNVVVVTFAESSTTQPTTRSTIRETETGVDVNACACRTIALAADSEDRDGWTQVCGLEQETTWSQEWTSWTSV